MVLCVAEGGSACSLRGDRVRGAAARLGAALRDLAASELGSALTDAGAVPVSRAPDPAVLADKLARRLAGGERALRTATTLHRASRVEPCPYRRGNVTPAAVEDAALRRRYYLSRSDAATDVQCEVAHRSLRRVYHRVLHPQNKLVIFLVDTTMIMTSIQSAVDIITEVLALLQPTDSFALMLTNTTELFKFEYSCANKEMMEIGNATESNKLLLKDYLSSIKQTTLSMLPLDIGKHLTRILNKAAHPIDKLIIFLSDTKVLKNEMWIKIVPTSYSNIGVFKFAVGVIDSNEIFYNSSFSVLHLEKWHNHSNNHSVMRILNNREIILGQIASVFISLLPATFRQDEMILLEPMWEATERDFVVSLVIPQNEGILGLDMYWSDLAEDFIYFNSLDEEQRAFVIDNAGRVVMHSHFPRPDRAGGDKIKFPPLELIENRTFIEELKDRLLGEVEGAVSYEDVECRWRRAGAWYVVCVCGRPEPTPPAVSAADWPPAPALLLPGATPAPRCQHFRRAATRAPALHLPPSAFRAPRAALRRSAEPAYRRDLLAYLRGAAAGLLASPGLRAGVRHAAHRAAAAAARLPTAMRSVRRRVWAWGGALAVAPGAAPPPDYEPPRREWVRAATQRPHRLQLSAPTLDPAGAGYVLTASVARGGLVAALDVPAALLARLVEDAMPECAGPALRCFVVNTRGYLAWHGAAPAAGPPERHHLAHREPALAVELLAREGPLGKRACRDAADGAVQRHYELTGGATGNGDCPRYALAPLPDVDAYLGVVNATSGGNRDAFCPCSTHDRLCLNCNRMERTECECPCECAADECESGSVALPLCPAPSELADHEAHYFPEEAEALEPCQRFECESRGESADCAGSVGCAWCERSRDGVTLLRAPHCTELEECWGGAAGAATPYGRAAVPPDGEAGGGALGPAAGALVLAALVLAVALYCYRAGAAPPGRETDTPAPPPAAWLDVDEGADVAEGGAGEEALGRARLLGGGGGGGALVVAARRAGSDHGYSTMTPHEDSEAAGPPASDDTRSEGSVAPPAAGVGTMLPRRLLAPVTVHRHMEAAA